MHYNKKKITSYIHPTNFKPETKSSSLASYLEKNTQTVSEAPLSSVVRLNIIVAALGALTIEKTILEIITVICGQAGHVLRK